jgi:beta-glucosidase
MPAHPTRRPFVYALLLGVLALSTTRAQNATTPSAVPTPPPYKNPALPVDQRVDDLLARMTLHEKVQQLRCIWQVEPKITTARQFDPDKAAALLSEGIGEFGPLDHPAEQEVALHNAIQKYLLEQTRLGIPTIFHNEACHGFLTNGASSFPVPIGLACSWDPELTERIYNVVAAEMRARGVSQALAPIMDICRDPRWGRTDETMGEDPYLNGKIGAAVVRGLQGSATGVVAEGHVAATLKHFAGHGQPESGINRAPGDIPPRELYDAHLVPFRIAIAEAHPAAVMPSYNEVDGVPSHNNAWLLQTVLRGEFHFQGLIVSDYDGIEYLSEVHAVAADHAEAAQKALQAGVDVDLPSGTAYANLEQLVQAGQVSQDAIDQAVRRVLRLKFSLGLFENPYGDAGKADALVHLDSTKALAREAAQKSIVLLTNRNHLLPLPKDKYHTIAVIGPNADQARLGSYSGDPLYKVSILQGLQNKLGASAKILYAQGCQITTNLPDSSMTAWNEAVAPRFPTDAQNQAAIAQAVQTAQQADLIVLVLGENEMLSREAWSAKHLGDRDSLDLVGAQNALADAIFALGKPVVVYLMNGRPLAVPNLAEKADALIEGWYMGQETGNAAADILFGDANPSGKLTITIPRATGQVPDYYDYKPSAKLFNYVDDSNKPLFPFGFGLSYTTFAYSAPRLASPTIPRDGSTTVTVEVTNTGSVPGDEIVECYIHHVVSSVTRPVKELKGFQRISLAPGQSQSVTFTIDHDTLAFHDLQMNDTVEPGAVAIMTGPSSDDLQSVTLRVQ